MGEQVNDFLKKNSFTTHTFAAACTGPLRFKKIQKSLFFILNPFELKESFCVICTFLYLSNFQITVCAPRVLGLALWLSDKNGGRRRHRSTNT